MMSSARSQSGPQMQKYTHPAFTRALAKAPIAEDSMAVKSAAKKAGKCGLESANKCGNAEISSRYGNVNSGWLFIIQPKHSKCMVGRARLLFIWTLKYLFGSLYKTLIW